MTFAASTIPAFTAALKAGLEARPVLKSVSVCDGPAPPADLARDELVEILDATVDQSVLIDRSSQPRYEDGTVTLLITVIWASRTKQTEVNARAFVILDELNQLLRGDTSLAAYITLAAGQSVYGARITRVRHTKRVDEQAQKREAALEVDVEWKAKI